MKCTTYWATVPPELSALLPIAFHSHSFPSEFQPEVRHIGRHIDNKSERSSGMNPYYRGWGQSENTEWSAVKICR